MTFATDIVCPRCRNKFSLGKVHSLCPCGSPLSAALGPNLYLCGPRSRSDCARPGFERYSDLFG